MERKLLLVFATFVTMDVQSQLFHPLGLGIETPRRMVGGHDGDVSETKLTERQQKIFNIIKKSPTITGRQMTEMLSVSQRTIEHDLSALQNLVFW